MADDDRTWTTCPDCGSDICPDDCGTTWCQNCGVVDWPLPADFNHEKIRIKE